MLYWSNLFHTGTREFAATSDLSDILPEEVEAKVKEAAEISMGTEISEDDIQNIQHLCDQVCTSVSGGCGKKSHGWWG
jgi:nucleolar protein 58